MSSLPQPPFPVRANYGYVAEQDDDLPFAPGQRITVDEVLDEEWFYGHYVDSKSNERFEGIFPISYVEIETPPARPTRAPHHKASGAPSGAPSAAASSTSTASTPVAPVAQVAPAESVAAAPPASEGSTPREEGSILPQVSESNPSKSASTATSAATPTAADTTATTGHDASNASQSAPLASEPASEPASEHASEPASAPAPVHSSISASVNRFKPQSDDEWDDDEDEWEDKEKSIVLGKPESSVPPEVDAKIAAGDDIKEKNDARTPEVKHVRKLSDGKAAEPKAEVSSPKSPKSPKSPQFKREEGNFSARTTESKPELRPEAIGASEARVSNKVSEASKESEVSHSQVASEPNKGTETRDAKVASEIKEVKEDPRFTQEPAISSSDKEPDFKTRLARFNTGSTEDEDRKVNRPERKSTFGRTLAFQENAEPEEHKERTVNLDSDEFKPSVSLKERIAMLQQEQQNERDAAEADKGAEERRRQRRARIAAEAEENRKARAIEEAKERERAAIEAEENRKAKELREKQEAQDRAEAEARLKAQAAALKEKEQTEHVYEYYGDDENEQGQNKAQEAQPGHHEHNEQGGEPEIKHEQHAHEQAGSKEVPRPTENYERHELTSTAESDEEDEDRADARRMALRERMARLAQSSGGMNLGMFMGASAPGAKPPGSLPKKERRISRSEYAAMSEAEIEAAEARREAEESAPISMFGVAGEAPPQAVFKPETEQTEPLEDASDDEAEYEESRRNETTGDVQSHQKEASNSESSHTETPQQEISHHERSYDSAPKDRTHEPTYAEHSYGGGPHRQPSNAGSTHKEALHREPSLSGSTHKEAEPPYGSPRKENSPHEPSYNAPHQELSQRNVPESPKVPGTYVPVETSLEQLKLDEKRRDNAEFHENAEFHDVHSSRESMLLNHPRGSEEDEFDFSKLNETKLTDAKLADTLGNDLSPVSPDISRIPTFLRPSSGHSESRESEDIPSQKSHVPPAVSPAAPDATATTHSAPPVPTVTTASTATRAPPAPPTPTATATRAPPAPPTATSMATRAPPAPPTATSNRAPPAPPAASASVTSAPAPPMHSTPHISSPGSPPERHPAEPSHAAAPPLAPRTAPPPPHGNNQDFTPPVNTHSTAHHGYAPPPVPPAHGVPPPPPPSTHPVSTPGHQEAPASPPQTAHIPTRMATAPPVPASAPPPPAPGARPPAPHAEPTQYQHNMPPPPPPPTTAPPPAAPAPAPGLSPVNSRAVPPPPTTPAPAVHRASTFGMPPPPPVARPVDDYGSHQPTHQTETSDHQQQHHHHHHHHHQEPASAPEQVKHDPTKLKQVSVRLGPQITGAAHEQINSMQPTKEWVRHVVESVLDAVLVGDTFGAEIYTNIGNASVKQVEEIRPGDICVCEDATFQGSKSPLQKYHKTYTNNAFVVGDWDGSKRKIHVVDSKKDSLKLNDLRKGVVRVFRVLDSQYINL